MMGYRVTKYDPEYRDEAGRFLRHDWISISDIAITPEGCAEYLLIEDAYVTAICAFHAKAGAPRLEVLGLEEHGISSIPPAAMDDTASRFARLPRDRVTDRAALEDVIRLALREVIWCRLERLPDFYVHFGYDYYAYVGGRRLGLPEGLPAQMFIEAMASPHHPDKDA